MRALIVKQSIATVSLSALCKLLRADHPFVLAKLRETVSARTGLRVSGGPFAGLKLSERSVSSELLPKLLGTYELELHRVIEEFLSTDYDVLINIGCGEGFYAVGFATRWRNRPARILAFDSNPVALEITRDVAVSNGVAEKVKCLSRCDPETFEIAKQCRVLVICDIEGAERKLLDPELAPGLLYCDILVEVHDGHGEPRIRQELEQRFSATHQCDVLRTAVRTVGDLDALAQIIPAPLALFALDENRDCGLAWMAMKRKVINSGQGGSLRARRPLAQ